MSSAVKTGVKKCMEQISFLEDLAESLVRPTEAEDFEKQPATSSWVDGSTFGSLTNFPDPQADALQHKQPVSQAMQESIKAGIVRSQLDGSVSQELQDDIRAGLTWAQSCGRRLSQDSTSRARSKMPPKRAAQVRGGSPTKLAAPELGRTAAAPPQRHSRRPERGSQSPQEPALVHERAEERARHNELSSDVQRAANEAAQMAARLSVHQNGATLDALQNQLEKRRRARREHVEFSVGKFTGLPAVDVDDDSDQPVQQALTEAMSEQQAKLGATLEENAKLQTLLQKAMMALAESESQRGQAEQQRDHAQQQLLEELESNCQQVAVEAHEESNQDDVRLQLGEAKLVADKARSLLQKVLTSCVQPIKQRGGWVLLRPHRRRRGQPVPALFAVLSECCELPNEAAEDERSHYKSLKACVHDGEMMVGLGALIEAMQSMVSSHSNSTFTVHEISTFLIGTAFGEFAKWLLGSRQHHFKRHDVESEGRLGVQQMSKALMEYLGSIGTVLSLAVLPGSELSSMEQILSSELSMLDSSVKHLHESTGLAPPGQAEREQFVQAEQLAELARATEASEGLRDLCTDLAKQLQSLRKKHSQSQAKIQQLTEAHGVLKQQNSAYQQQLGQLEPALLHMTTAIAGVDAGPSQEQAEEHMEAMAQLVHAQDTISGLKAECRKLKGELQEVQQAARISQQSQERPSRSQDRGTGWSQDSSRRNSEDESSLREDNQMLRAEVQVLISELELERQERTEEAVRLRQQLQEAYRALEEERGNVQTTLARLKVLKEELKTSQRPRRN